MNNKNAERAIDDCQNELNQIDGLIQAVGAMSPMNKYLTRYSVIKACGTIEYAFKSILSDIHSAYSTQISHFIDVKVRNSSCNPSYDNICSKIKEFDQTWCDSFKQKINSTPNPNKLRSSLASLNENRNAFAHGNGCTASFSDVKEYFSDAVEIIVKLDEVVR